MVIFLKLCKKILFNENFGSLIKSLLPQLFLIKFFLFILKGCLTYYIAVYNLSMAELNFLIEEEILYTNFINNCLSYKTQKIYEAAEFNFGNALALIVFSFFLFA